MTALASVFTRFVVFTIAAIFLAAFKSAFIKGAIFSMFYFNRNDIMEAYIIYATKYHSGQNSPEYKIFSRLHKIGFNPRPDLTTERDLTENGRDIFECLVFKKCIHIQ
jgi:hypothetical protein